MRGLGSGPLFAPLCPLGLRFGSHAGRKAHAEGQIAGRLLLDIHVDEDFVGRASLQRLDIDGPETSLVVVLMLRKGWPAFFQTMLSYAFASRIPVLIVMLMAMLGDWGTHYELGPPGYPEMGFVTKFILIALFPQMTFWIMFTMVVGTLFGGIAATLVGPKVTAEADAGAGQPSAETDVVSDAAPGLPEENPEKAEDTP